MDKRGRRLWHYPFGHEIRSIGITGEGRYIAAGANDNYIYFLDQTGKMLWRHKISGDVWNVVVCPHGRYIASGSLGGGLSLLNKRGKLLWNYPSDGEINNLAITPDGRFIAAGARNKMVVLLNNHGGVVWRYPAEEEVYSVAITADGRNIVAGCWSGTVIKLNRNGDSIWKFKSDFSILDVAVTTDGEKVAAAARDGHVYFLNSQGKPDWKFRTGGRAECVSIDPTGTSIVIGSSDEHVYMLNEDGSLAWKHKMAGQVFNVSITPDSRLIAIGSAEKTVHVLDNDGQIVWEYTLPSIIKKVSISDNGSRVAVAASDNSLYLLESVSAEALVSLEQLVVPDKVSPRDVFALHTKISNIGSDQISLEIAFAEIDGCTLVEGSRDVRIKAIPGKTQEIIHKYRTRYPGRTRIPLPRILDAGNGEELGAKHIGKQAEIVVETPVREPVLILALGSDGRIILDEWHPVRLKLTNQGNVPAKDMHITLSGEISHIEEILVDELKPGAEREINLSIRPVATGKAVPIMADLRFGDGNSKTYTQKIGLVIPVEDKDSIREDARTVSGTPALIHIEHVGELIGQKIEKVEGDLISDGGNKTQSIYAPSFNHQDMSTSIKDSVVQRTAIQPGENIGEKCSNCGTPLPRNARFCHSCGTKTKILQINE